MGREDSFASVVIQLLCCFSKERAPFPFWKRNFHIQPVKTQRNLTSKFLTVLSPGRIKHVKKYPVKYNEQK